MSERVLEESMRLVAIYNVWDDWDMLRLSVENMRPVVDGVIIIASNSSNSGEESPIQWGDDLQNGFSEIYQFEPKPELTPMQNETDKRNHGLHLARLLGFTHFITMDADEFYHSEDISRGTKMFQDNQNLKGIVVSSQVYFKSPTITIGLDTTRVPFIHKITPDLKHCFNRNYPFAWEGLRDIRIDPTRSLNINDGVEFVPEIVMHHYSWVRSDYEKKIRNSTARANIEKSTIRQDLLNATDGYYCNFYGKVLHTVHNYFNIPDYGVSL